ncbi:MAG TPA: zf-HC2 domain-containing protein, partial [Terriglobales bacterium]|nr:zf-HC2 domain-containing protein [Terriglobales bacterium]
MTQFANKHERAFGLWCMSVVESISPGEQRWLEDHLAGCADCRKNAQQTNSAIAALKSISIVAGNDVVQSTRRRVRELCLRNGARRQRMRPIWISSVFASVWMACTTPYLWQTFDMTGHWLHIPDLLWQMGFLVAWFTPALTGAAVALWLRPVSARGVCAQISP